MNTRAEIETAAAGSSRTAAPVAKRLAWAGGALTMILVAAGIFAAWTALRSNTTPLDPAAATGEARAPDNFVAERPVLPAELDGSEWRVSDDWAGDDESLHAVVTFEDANGAQPRLIVGLNCNATVYEIAWDGWTFTSREVGQNTQALCFDPDADIDTFWRSAATFVAWFSEDTLVIERDGETVRLEQTAFRRPNRADADGEEQDLVDPELIFGEWRIIDLGPEGGLIDQAGRADDIRLTLTADAVLVQHSCQSVVFSAEWSAGSLWTRQAPAEPSLPVGCSAHPGLTRLVDFLDRSGWIAIMLVDGQLELARSPGTERIRAMTAGQ